MASLPGLPARAQPWTAKPGVPQSAPPVRQAPLMTARVPTGPLAPLALGTRPPPLAATVYKSPHAAAVASAPAPAPVPDPMDTAIADQAEEFEEVAPAPAPAVAQKPKTPAGPAATTSPAIKKPAIPAPVTPTPAPFKPSLAAVVSGAKGTPAMRPMPAAPRSSSLEMAAALAANVEERFAPAPRASLAKAPPKTLTEMGNDDEDEEADGDHMETTVTTPAGAAQKTTSRTEEDEDGAEDSDEDGAAGEEEPDETTPEAKGTAKTPKKRGPAAAGGAGTTAPKKKKIPIAPEDRVRAGSFIASHIVIRLPERSMASGNTNKTSTLEDFFDHALSSGGGKSTWTATDVLKLYAGYGVAMTINGQVASVESSHVEPGQRFGQVHLCYHAADAKSEAQEDSIIQMPAGCVGMFKDPKLSRLTILECILRYRQLIGLSDPERIAAIFAAMEGDGIPVLDSRFLTKWCGSIPAANPLPTFEALRQQAERDQADVAGKKAAAAAAARAKRAAKPKIASFDEPPSDGEALIAGMDEVPEAAAGGSKDLRAWKQDLPRDTAKANGHAADDGDEEGGGGGMPGLSAEALAAIAEQDKKSKAKAASSDAPGAPKKMDIVASEPPKNGTTTGAKRTVSQAKASAPDTDDDDDGAAAAPRPRRDVKKAKTYESVNVVAQISAAELTYGLLHDSAEAGAMILAALINSDMWPVPRDIAEPTAEAERVLCRRYVEGMRRAVLTAVTAIKTGRLTGLPGAPFGTYQFRWAPELRTPADPEDALFIVVELHQMVSHPLLCDRPTPVITRRSVLMLNWHAVYARMPLLAPAPDFVLADPIMTLCQSGGTVGLVRGLLAHGASHAVSYLRDDLLHRATHVFAYTPDQILDRLINVMPISDTVLFTEDSD